MATQKSKNRKIPINIKYKLYAESGFKCLNCGHDLFDIKDWKDKEVPKHRNQFGDIAHIISVNAENVRPNNVTFEYNHINFKKINNNGENIKKYDDKIINSFENTVIVCLKCHKNFDNPKIEKPNKNVDKKLWWNESANKMANLKKSTNFENNIVNLIFVGSNQYFDSLNLNKNDKKIVNKKTVNKNKQQFLKAIIKENKEYKLVIEVYDFYENILEIKNKEIHKKFLNSFDNLQIHDKFYESFCEIIKILNSLGDDTNLNLKTKITKNDDDKIINLKISFFKYNNHFKLRTKKEAQKEFQTEFKNFKNDWISNDTNVEKIKESQGFKDIKNLLLSLLFDFFNNEKKDLESSSIAYNARWGTGKTSVIRAIAKELKKWCVFVEINLWHISNVISAEQIKEKENNALIKTIVKESITQILQDNNVANQIIDSHKIKKEEEKTIEKEIFNIISNTSYKHLNKNIDAKENIITNERKKFIDEYIYVLNKIINDTFKSTQKPIVFIFDDLDRVEEDKKIVKLLDALVSFMKIKNSIYILPIDESKITKAIFKEKKQDPYNFFNKYFTYSLRPPFIPNIEISSIVNKVIETFELKQKIEKSGWSDYNLNIFKNLLPLFYDTLNPTYRSIKDYINIFYNNFKSFLENGYTQDLAKKLNKNTILPIILLSTILQIEFPSLIDFMCKSIKNKNFLFEKYSYRKEIIESENIWENFNNKKNKKFTNEEALFWESISFIDMKSKEFKNFLKEETPNTQNQNNFNFQQKNSDYQKELKIGYKKIKRFTNIIERFSSYWKEEKNKLFIWLSLTKVIIENEDVKKYIELSDVEGKLFEEKENFLAWLSKGENNE